MPNKDRVVPVPSGTQSCPCASPSRLEGTRVGQMCPPSATGLGEHAPSSRGPWHRDNAKWGGIHSWPPSCSCHSRAGEHSPERTPQRTGAPQRRGALVNPAPAPGPVVRGLCPCWGPLVWGHSAPSSTSGREAQGLSQLTPMAPSDTGRAERSWAALWAPRTIPALSSAPLECQVPKAQAHRARCTQPKG